MLVPGWGIQNVGCEIENGLVLLAPELSFGEHAFHLHTRRIHSAGK
jgi:hypothetical protein